MVLGRPAPAPTPSDQVDPKATQRLLWRLIGVLDRCFVQPVRLKMRTALVHQRGLYRPACQPLALPVGAMFTVPDPPPFLSLNLRFPLPCLTSRPLRRGGRRIRAAAVVPRCPRCHGWQPSWSPWGVSASGRPGTSRPEPAAWHGPTTHSPLCSHITHSAGLLADNGLFFVAEQSCFSNLFCFLNNKTPAQKCRLG